MFKYLNKMSFPDDESILTMMLQEDTRNEGFRVFINKYKERLYFLIRRMVENHDDADDVLQNTFLKVVKHIHNFGGHSSLFTWVYRIATNECLNFMASAQKHGRLRPIEEISEQPIAPSQIDGEGLLYSLEQAIRALPEKQRMVFNLRYHEELPYTDIAEITGTSVGALKASYHHAVKKIEEQIKSGTQL